MLQILIYIQNNYQFHIIGTVNRYTKYTAKGHPLVQCRSEKHNHDSTSRYAYNYTHWTCGVVVIKLESKGCLWTDCGQCTGCLDKKKFGGPERKKACKYKKCTGITKQTNGNSIGESIDKQSSLADRYHKQ